jgi:hypothetical protein
MTTISNSHAGRDRARLAPLPLRACVYMRRQGLTHALAQGAPPTSRPELALRATQLTSRRNRRGLARTLRRTITDANNPVPNPFHVAPIRRTAVLEAEEAIRAMIERLDDSMAVDAEGMAMAEQIITNANCSPLYTPCEPGALRRQIRVATEALGLPR